MKFSTEPIDDAAGGVLAHGIKRGNVNLKKGRVLSADDVALLASQGFSSVVVARLEPEDVSEDEAAAAIAGALAGEGTYGAAATTGRANLYAGARGVLLVHAAEIDRANAVDETMTVATLPDASRVVPGQMVATVKIIPFAVPRTALARCLEALRASQPVISVAAFRAHCAGLVQTRLPGLKDSVLEKTVRVTEARLRELGSTLGAAVVVAHDQSSVASAVATQRQRGLNPILIAGASAIVDRRDVVPAAIVAAGGEIVHFGMPVDPGNLLLLAQLVGAAVIGLPGCARSPQPNGFDMVLQRVLAGLPVGPSHIRGWGVGGLLNDIPQRPQPRQSLPTPAARSAPPSSRRIAAVILAAGQGSRMGSGGKLLLDVAGQPLLRAAVDAARASRASPVVVVTGHRAEEVRTSLDDADVRFVHNPVYPEGLAGSLAAGIRSLPHGLDGAVVLLGDMPRVRGRHVDALIAAFEGAPPETVCVPVHRGRRGNPVLWPASLFRELAALQGDVGGRALLHRHRARVLAVEMADDAVLVDVDEPKDLAALTAMAPS
jgi:molybdenum cofactor cytidylyltransferase